VVIQTGRPLVLGKGEVGCQSKQVEVMEKECVKSGSFQGTVLLSAKGIFFFFALTYLSVD
jgi:hypothetical protein